MVFVYVGCQFIVIWSALDIVPAFLSSAADINIPIRKQCLLSYDLLYLIF